MHRSYDRKLENSSVYQINENKYTMYHTAQKVAQQLGVKGFNILLEDLAIGENQSVNVGDFCEAPNTRERNTEIPKTIGIITDIIDTKSRDNEQSIKQIKFPSNNKQNSTYKLKVSFPGSCVNETNFDLWKTINKEINLNSNTNLYTNRYIIPSDKPTDKPIKTNTQKKKQQHQRKQTGEKDFTKFLKYFLSREGLTEKVLNNLKHFEYKLTDDVSNKNLIFKKKDGQKDKQKDKQKDEQKDKQKDGQKDEQKDKQKDKKKKPKKLRDGAKPYYTKISSIETKTILQKIGDKRLYIKRPKEIFEVTMVSDLGQRVGVGPITISSDFVELKEDWTPFWKKNKKLKFISKEQNKELDDRDTYTVIKVDDRTATATVINTETNEKKTLGISDIQIDLRKEDRQIDQPSRRNKQSVKKNTTVNISDNKINMFREMTTIKFMGEFLPNFIKFYEVKVKDDPSDPNQGIYYQYDNDPVEYEEKEFKDAYEKLQNNVFPIKQREHLDPKDITLEHYWLESLHQQFIKDEGQKIIWEEEELYSRLWEVSEIYEQETNQEMQKLLQNPKKKSNWQWDDNLTNEIEELKRHQEKFHKMIKFINAISNRKCQESSNSKLVSCPDEVKSKDFYLELQDIVYTEKEEVSPSTTSKSKSKSKEITKKLNELHTLRNFETLYSNRWGSNPKSFLKRILGEHNAHHYRMDKNCNKGEENKVSAPWKPFRVGFRRKEEKTERMKEVEYTSKLFQLHGIREKTNALEYKADFTAGQPGKDLEDKLFESHFLKVIKLPEEHPGGPDHPDFKKYKLKKKSPERIIKDVFDRFDLHGKLEIRKDLLEYNSYYTRNDRYDCFQSLKDPNNWTDEALAFFIKKFEPILDCYRIKPKYFKDESEEKVKGKSRGAITIKYLFKLDTIRYFSFYNLSVFLNNKPSLEVLENGQPTIDTKITNLLAWDSIQDVFYPDSKSSIHTIDSYWRFEEGGKPTIFEKKIRKLSTTDEYKKKFIEDIKNQKSDYNKRAYIFSRMLSQYITDHQDCNRPKDFADIHPCSLSLSPKSSWDESYRKTIEKKNQMANLSTSASSGIYRKCFPLRNVNIKDAKCIEYRLQFYKGKIDFQEEHTSKIDFQEEHTSKIDFQEEHTSISLQDDMGYSEDEPKVLKLETPTQQPNKQNEKKRKATAKQRKPAKKPRETATKQRKTATTSTKTATTSTKTTKAGAARERKLTPDQHRRQRRRILQQQHKKRMKLQSIEKFFQQNKNQINELNSLHKISGISKVKLRQFFQQSSDKNQIKNKIINFLLNEPLENNVVYYQISNNTSRGNILELYDNNRVYIKSIPNFTQQARNIINNPQIRQI